jgi:alpha-galactosidase
VVRSDQTPIESALGIGQLQVYAGPLSGGGFGAGLVNTDTIQANNVTLNWGELGLPVEKRMAVRDVWRRRDLGVFSGQISLRVEPHDTVLLRLEIAPH